MIFARPYDFYKTTPSYQQAFDEGYQAAKKEMLEYLQEIDTNKTQTITLNIITKGEV